MLSALRKAPQPLSVLTQLLDLPCPGRLPFVTLYRTYVNLFTAIAILAVDFQIYPRRLAKAETYGSGLMDVGVGCFLLAHGITAPEARHPEHFKSVPSLRSYLRAVGVTLRAVLPLFVLGLLRLMSVKSTDYQEHVTEYGVHWNFFFTIAVVRVSTAVVRVSTAVVRVSTAVVRVSTAVVRVSTAVVRVSTAVVRVSTAVVRVSTAVVRVSTAVVRVSTAVVRVSTAVVRVSTAVVRVSTAVVRVSTAVVRVSTAVVRVSTAVVRVSTAVVRVSTAVVRVSTA